MMLYDGVAYSRDDIHHYGLKLFGLHRHLPLRSVVQFGKSRAKMIYAPILIMPLLDTNIVCHRSASDRAQETMQDRFVAMLGIGATDRGTDRKAEQWRDTDAGPMDGRQSSRHQADSPHHRGERDRKHAG